jgi:aryl-alcohol dehydrogenase-like predicted oxidoreductase
MMTKETDKETEIRKAETALGSIGEGFGSRAQTALRFALACPRLSLCLVGVGAPDHMDEAIAAEAKGPLPADALARLEPVYESDFTSG